MSKSRTPTARLLDAPDYVADLVAAINAAKTRVAITSMIIAGDKTTNALFTALKAAVKRGVSVDVVADSFTFSEFGGHFNPFKQYAARSKAARASGRELQAAGVSFTWLDDRLKPNPFAGVTHTKWSVVDDLCYVFGGVNLYAEGIADNADYMFRINDKRLADTLVQQQAALLEHPAPEYPGYEGAWDGDTWYIDSGKPNDSAIYAQACLLAAKAKHILYVSQYSPSGPLARLLREHDAACYYNLPQNAGFPTNIMLRYDQYTNKIPSLYTRTKYIHAKFIIFTLPGGKKAAITGSHNFSYKGVVFGTREIALATHNADIVHQLEDFYSANIA